MFCCNQVFWNKKFIEILKTRGPRVQPWGTPYITPVCWDASLRLSYATSSVSPVPLWLSVWDTILLSRDNDPNIKCRSNKHSNISTLHSLFFFALSKPLLLPLSTLPSPLLLHNPIMCSNDLSLSICVVVMPACHHRAGPWALGQWESSLLISLQWSC